MDSNKVIVNSYSFGEKSSHQVYNTISRSKEWLIVNCTINAARRSLPSFYIFYTKVNGLKMITSNMAKDEHASQWKGNLRWFFIYLKSFYHFSKGQF